MLYRFTKFHDLPSLCNDIEGLRDVSNGYYIPCSAKNVPAFDNCNRGEVAKFLTNFSNLVSEIQQFLICTF